MGIFSQKWWVNSRNTEDKHKPLEEDVDSKKGKPGLKVKEGPGKKREMLTRTHMCTQKMTVGNGENSQQKWNAFYWEEQGVRVYPMPFVKCPSSPWPGILGKRSSVSIRKQSGECRGLRSSSGESPRAEQRRGILTEIFGSCSPLAATAPWKVTEDCPSCCSRWQGEGVSIRNDSGMDGRQTLGLLDAIQGICWAGYSSTFRERGL